MSTRATPPRLRLRPLVAFVSLAAVLAPWGSLRAQTPADVARELIEADRAFAAAAAETDLISGLSAMFAENVIMPAPGGVFVHCAAEATELLRTNPANAASRATWVPLRAGVSADGLHGFTFGNMTIYRPDSTRAQAKYMTYWERQPDGWRARAYKRAARDSVDATTSPMEPSLPAALVAPQTDPAIIRAHEQSLAETENSFSRDAQSIGLGPAFARYGSPDAVNMGPPSGTYIVGSEEISRRLFADQPTGSSPVTWGADEVIVASSGDLGITFGLIRSNDPAPDSTPFPFFTIWRRASPDEPWRYVAE